MGILRQRGEVQEAASATAKGAPQAEGLDVDLEGAVPIWLADTVLLLALRSDRLLLVTLTLRGGAVSRMQART